jgi:hypothetical protein
MTKIVLVLVSAAIFVLAAALKETGFHFLGASATHLSQLVIGQRAYHLPAQLRRHIERNSGSFAGEILKIVVNDA